MAAAECAFDFSTLNRRARETWHVILILQYNKSKLFTTSNFHLNLSLSNILYNWNIDIILLSALHI